CQRTWAKWRSSWPAMIQRISTGQPSCSMVGPWRCGRAFDGGDAGAYRTRKVIAHPNTSASLIWCTTPWRSPGESKIIGYLTCLLQAYPARYLVCNPSHRWLRSSLGRPLKNEEGAGRVREALDHLVDRRFRRHLTY